MTLPDDPEYDSVPDDGDEWECPHCFAENDGASEVCYQCEEIRP